MDPGINRAEQLYLAWEERQKSLLGLMGTGVDERKMKKLKCRFLSAGLFRVSVRPSEMERLYIQVLRSVTAKLRKELYPNLLLRFFVGLKAVVIDKSVHLSRFSRLREENISSLKEQLSSLGLRNVDLRLEERLDYERQRIVLDVVRGLNTGEKLSLQLSFEREDIGVYRFSGFNGRMLGKDGSERSCFFSREAGIDLVEAINLLRGGSVLKEYQGLDGNLGKCWVKVNDTAKDFSSSPLLYFSGTGQEYDLKKQLLDHAIALECYAISTEVVLRGLEQGNRMKINVPGKDKFYIRADPFENRLEFFDSGKKEIAFEQLKDMLVPVKAQPSFGLGADKQLDMREENQLEMGR
ncbi:hypothetical protein OC25_03690 [Pedobacter kyungheensis]|uniref:Uncharacterized protein n=1 Tax=Pedobacter kyungheensis TaxID=1069985 RepID=A0A0C1DEY1_9SPHI|nr:hypothetical protein [Pedobacter kyungheensis]KIA96196.1 hypothetical protein OC25_03690 [Pedobacter kyungheensis]